jgi:hypothetical protein
MAKVKAMTQEWMDAYKAAIQADPDYKQSQGLGRQCRPDLQR